ncbi:MAG: DNA repair protein RecO [bacterium]|nr:DNA repair protein RecO [bacterium]
MESIVLSRRDFREFDQIISLYTKDKGKIELLARGVKKMQSKNSAHLEPFSYVEIEIIKGRTIDYLTKVVSIDFFSVIRQNIDLSLNAGFLSSFIDIVTEVNEKDIKVFELFLTWLKFVERTDKFKNILTDAFIINLFSLLGFNPILDYCVVCKKEYKEMVSENILNRKSLGMYFAGGGIICSRCRQEKRLVYELVMDIGLKEISNLQMVLKGDWKLIQEFNMENIEQKKLHKLIYEFVLFHSEKRIEDWGLHIKT